MKIHCTKCNSIIDTEDDPEHIGDELDFAFCRNPDCLWVINIKEDTCSVVGEDTSLPNGVAEQAVVTENSLQTPQTHKYSALDAFKTLRKFSSEQLRGSTSEMIFLHEELLQILDTVTPNTSDYAVLKEEIGSVCGNFYDMPERYFADFHFNLAGLYSKERKHTNSIKHYEKAIEYMPLLPHLYCYLSETLLKARQLDATISLWKTALKLPFSKEDMKDIIKPHYKEALNVINEKKEQVAFAKKEVLPLINKNPGILQTDLYKLIDVPQFYISDTLYELATQGIVQRQKKGRTYALYLTSKKRPAFPDRTKEIKFHKENAYKFLKDGKYDIARSSFFKWVESVRQQNINMDGALKKDLEEAKKAYSEFVRVDPTYKALCNIALPMIRENPGTLQTDLYKMFPQVDKQDLSYTLYFAAEHGKIQRIKRGRTYSLSPIPSQ